MKIFAQLEKAQLENTTSDTGSLPKGMITYRTDLNIAKVSNGTSMLALIDESSTQTLSGKTYATPNFTGAFNMAQAATPSNPSSGNNKFYFKADGKLYTLDSSGNEALVGSGSGGVKNLITNGSADDTAASIFTAYADAAATRPVDGTGGSPTVTTSITTTTPLDGTKAFLLTKTAANSQGQGWSVPFTVDPAYRAKSLKISVDYIVNSGTFVAGGAGVESDVIWNIYDVTNSQLIEPSNIKMFSNNSSLSDKFEATFQSSATGSSYRLIAHVQSVSALAYELKVDNITVSPQTYVFGTPVTDLQSMTTTGSFNNGTYSGFYRRVGDNLECNVRYIATSADTSGNRLKFNLPSGLSIDTAKLTGTGTNNKILGSGLVYDNSATTPYACDVIYSSTTEVALRLHNSSSTYATTASAGGPDNTTPFTWAVNDSAEAVFTVPISGWSSSVQMSDSADTRICAARYSTAAGQSIATGTTAIVDFGTKTSDTHGAVTTGASWKFTAPVAGRYAIKASIRMSSSTTTGGTFLYLYKNGSSVSYSVFTQNQSVNGVLALPQLNDSIDLIAGDYIDFRVAHANAGSLTIHNDASVNFVNIERISGPSAIAATETVAARYKSSAAQSFTSGATTIIDFATQTFDTHGTVTTGASWKFTAPIAGKYQVSAHTSIGAAADGGARQLFIYKNGSVWSQALQEKQSTTSVAIAVQVCDLVQCNAGDTIDLRFSQNSGGTLSFTSISDRIWVSILRVGN